MSITTSMEVWLLSLIVNCKSCERFLFSWYIVSGCFSLMQCLFVYHLYLHSILNIEDFIKLSTICLKRLIDIYSMNFVFCLLFF